MTPPLLSTAYLPSVAYMAVLARHGNIAIEQKETFPKQTFRNRTAIVTGNGILMLNVPVVRPYGNHTRTEQITISYNEPWNIRHWRAIVAAYSAAPYFLYYRDGLEKILLQHHDRLIDLNDAILNYLLQKLKINCHITYTDTFTPPSDNPSNLRNILTNKHSLPQPNSQFPPYPQVFDTRFGFIPNLSAIDLLFNLGPEAKPLLMQVSYFSPPPEAKPERRHGEGTLCN